MSDATQKQLPVSDGQHLHVVEWSEQGKPLVFLAGLGQTAHAMGFLASHFTRDYRCIGITRRGFGQSSKGQLDYTSSRLASDVLDVCDQLGIETACYLAHSFGCREIAWMHELRADQVAACVLLDGAYDPREEDKFLRHQEPVGSAPEPGNADLASLDQLGAFVSRTFGVRFPPEELAAQYTLDETHTRLVPTADPDAVATMAQQAQTVNWAILNMPVLAAFAFPERWQDYAPGLTLADADVQRRFEEFFEKLMSLKEEEIENFAQNLPDALIGRPPGSNHFLHLSHEWLVVKWIRQLLLNAAW